MIKNFIKNHYFARFLEFGIFGFARADDVIKFDMRPYLSQNLMFFLNFFLYV